MPYISSSAPVVPFPSKRVVAELLKLFVKLESPFIRLACLRVMIEERMEDISARALDI